MRPQTIWFNKYLGNTWKILSRLRAVRRPGEFQILCTHPWTRYRGRLHADGFEREPGGLDDAGYVDYCLDVARRRQVDLFLPGHHRVAIVRARKRFEALGTQVFAAGDAATLALLANKVRVYRDLAGHGFRLPEYEVVNNLAGFDAAWARLRPRHDALCYKPAVSIYGIGFYVVVDSPRVAQSLGPRERFHISLKAARRQLAAKNRFRDLLVMEHLPGPERSVDCLARDGKLLRCVVRRKDSDKVQVLEDNPRLVAVVRRLTRHFRLTNLFNMQFRDAGGRPYLLEINPRMSGGILRCCQSGLELPYWAIRLALGTAEQAELPQPRTGLLVRTGRDARQRRAVTSL